MDPEEQLLSEYLERLEHLNPAEQGRKLSGVVTRLMEEKQLPPPSTPEPDALSVLIRYYPYVGRLFNNMVIISGKMKRMARIVGLGGLYEAEKECNEIAESIDRITSGKVERDMITELCNLAMSKGATREEITRMMNGK